MADNVTQQIAVLADTYRLLLAEGDIVRADLKAKIIAAQAIVEDGAEIIAIGNERSTTNAQVFYPTEIVLAAALIVWKETDPANTRAAAANQSAVHADLSRTRIES
jgi:hypothetical protein